VAEKSWPYDTSNTAVLEAEWQKMAREWLATGVVTGRLNQLAVSADGSVLGVSVASGRAVVDGFFYENDAAKAVAIAAADATNPRIDRIVVRMDRRGTTNTTVTTVVKGTPAASPTAPALTQTDELFELLLADVTVPAAAGVIVAGNVTDRRTFSKNLTEAAGNTAYVRRDEIVNGTVSTTESTTSTVYADLATVGASATATIGPSGRAIIIISGRVSNNTAGQTSHISAAGPGLVAGDTTALSNLADAANSLLIASHVFVAGGLTVGAGTFTLKYRVTGGTGSFSHRRLAVIPI
jgi:hypothetical protein